MKINLLAVKISFTVMFLLSSLNVLAQELVNDVTSPLHAMQPDYPIPYGAQSIQEVTATLDRVYNFLESKTASKLIDSKTNKEVVNLKNLDKNTVFEPGVFRLTSYEWGVTYGGMLLATEATGNSKYANYTNKRLKLIADIAPFYNKMLKKDKNYPSPIIQSLHPEALDDAGAVCAAMIKAQRAGLNADLKPLIDNFIAYISNKQFRLPDGTLARNRPQPNTLWLDDLFMSVPALAQMGKLTGDIKYFDDAVKQVRQFSERMFNNQNGLYMHGWVQSMEEHPQFHWARANGWAVMTLVELLEVLPKDHSGYKDVLNQLRAHIKGLVHYQDGTGFWHQLIDRNDTYLETSATAIYAYSITRAINRGYIDKAAYSPVAMLAWNAVSTKVNEKGHVEGTCVGTGMGFDPAFYYYRPIHVYAAHGYGPVMLAGAEIIMLLKNNDFEINDSSLQLKANK
ncbi:glycoside hydrolase family 88 protein [Mariniflexile litorale]|uniref:Glycoside hydrolase family 88 protein n=1 Tax=Mariniflexile litorale TaxID=3045158 RepID=A0AAU7EJA1_9FLAO|nr:glycoside hydrolase family 88 protein [Mariniflexile sp. KMM 9835]MDQ8210637.1 glycoside hydrolase family 88 protein [Mariniflexile sp. KMM 9835]